MKTRKWLASCPIPNECVFHLCSVRKLKDEHSTATTGTEIDEELVPRPEEVNLEILKNLKLISHKLVDFTSVTAHDKQMANAMEAMVLAIKDVAAAVREPKSVVMSPGTAALQFDVVPAVKPARGREEVEGEDGPESKKGGRRRTAAGPSKKRKIDPVSGDDGDDKVD